MKSIHFNQVPTMSGKRTMRFTDVVAENFKQRELAKVHEREMRDEREPVYHDWEDPDLEMLPFSWDCHICAWVEYTGWPMPEHEHDDA